MMMMTLKDAKCREACKPSSGWRRKQRIRWLLLLQGAHIICSRFMIYNSPFIIHLRHLPPLNLYWCCCSLCDVWFASPPSNIISQTRPTVFAIANINSGSVAYHRSVLHRVSPLPICRATSTDTNTTSHLMRGGVRGEYDIVEYIKSELLLSSPQEVLISHSPLHLHSTALHIPIPLNSHMYAGSMCRTLIIRGEREKKT